MIDKSQSSCKGSFTDSIYDETTQSINGSERPHSLYDPVTVVNTCMHNSPLPAHENLLNLGLRGKGLYIGHLNIQEIRSSEKIDQINTILQSKDNICMLGLSESKLGSDVPDNFLSIENYQCFRKDRICGAGGLLVYVTNDVVCDQRKDLETENFESMWLEVQPKNSKSFLVGHFYRNPHSSAVWSETFEDHLEKVINEDKEIFILGDFKKDLLNLQINKNWIDYMLSHGLIQHVDKPTRVTNCTSFLIDHVYSNFSDNIKYIDVPKIGLSGHYPIFLTRKIGRQEPRICHHTIIKYRSFKNFDEEKFIDELQAIPWDAVQKSLKMWMMH